MLENTNVPIMEKAVRVIYDMSEDTRVREMARLREKALHDEASLLKDARNEGRAEMENEIIARMQEMGYSDNDIKGIFE